MLIDRVRARLQDEDISEDLLSEYIDTVSDRLCMRLGGLDDLPSQFNSICVDATVKMYRRRFYEGINSENDEGLNVSFVDDVLAEYNSEIESYKNTKRKLRFI